MRNRFSQFIICMALVIAMTFMTTGCNASSTKDAPAQTAASVESSMAETTTVAKESDMAESAPAESGTDAADVMGEGNMSFGLTVTDADGKETAFEIHTDQDTVGKALLELDMIAGDDGEYGLYVKTVNGITVDYDKDGKYWAFYIDGEYATTGVDSTPVTDGSTYAFKVEK